ncbi:hypothetical protein ACJX0J_009331, partial [Zea mays]
EKEPGVYVPAWLTPPRKKSKNRVEDEDFKEENIKKEKNMWNLNKGKDIIQDISTEENLTKEGRVQITDSEEEDTSDLLGEELFAAGMNIGMYDTHKKWDTGEKDEDDSGIMLGSQEEKIEGLLLKGIWKAGIKIRDDNLESIDLVKEMEIANECLAQKKIELEKDKGKEVAPYMQDDHGSNSDFLCNEEGKKKREKRLGIKISPIGKGQENPEPNRKKTKGAGKIPATNEKKTNKGRPWEKSLITQHKLAFFDPNGDFFWKCGDFNIIRYICLEMFQDLHEGKLNTAFLKGRSIMSGIRKNETGIFLKLDFEKAYDKVNWNFMHKRIMLLLKSEIAPIYIFVINGDEETTTNFIGTFITCFKHKPSFLWQKIIVKKYFHGKDLYNIKRPLCTIDPELYEICDDKFILVKDARIKNWQLFDGYQFARGPGSSTARNIVMATLLVKFGGVDIEMMKSFNTFMRYVRFGIYNYKVLLQLTLHSSPFSNQIMEEHLFILIFISKPHSIFCLFWGQHTNELIAAAQENMGHELTASHTRKLTDTTIYLRVKRPASVDIICLYFLDFYIKILDRKNKGL